MIERKRINKIIELAKEIEIKSRRLIRECKEIEVFNYLSKLRKKVKNKEVDLYDLPIQALNLSARPFNSLWAVGKRRIIDILTCSERDICVLRDIGKVSIKEIKEKLAKVNLRIGMLKNNRNRGVKK